MNQNKEILLKGDDYDPQIEVVNKKLSFTGKYLKDIIRGNGRIKEALSKALAKIRTGKITEVDINLESFSEEKSEEISRFLKSFRKKSKGKITWHYFGFLKPIVDEIRYAVGGIFEYKNDTQKKKKII